MGFGPVKNKAGRIGGKMLAAALLATTALPPGIALMSTGSFAQSRAETTFNIPSGSLSGALAAFGSQSGTQVSYEASIAAGKSSPGIRGAATREQALAQILQGSGLVYTFKDPSNVLITDRVSAAHATTPSGSSMLLSTINVSGRGGAQSVYTDPASSVYITAEQLDRYGRLSPSDMLRGQPGVQVGDSRNGGGVDVNIRGLQGQSRVAVTVDGSQQSLNVYRGYAGTQQRSYFDPDLISDVTITKGPGLSPSAAGAIAGTVNMTTLRPEDIIKPGKNWGVRLKGELWDNGVKQAYRPEYLGSSSELATTPHDSRPNLFDSKAKSGSVAAAFTSDHIDLVAAYARRNQGNYFAGKHGREKYREFDKWGYENNTVAKSYMAGEEVLNTSVSTESALLKATIKPTDEQQLELSYRYFDGEFGEIMPSDIFRFGTGGVYQYPVGSMVINSASARYSFDPKDNDLIDFKANFWATGAKSDQINATNGPKSQWVYGSSDRSWVRMDNTRVGGDLSNRSEFKTEAGAFALDFGGGFQYEDIRPQDGVVITEHDLNSNRNLRDGYRTEVNLSGKLEYKPRENLQFWAGGRYGRYSSHDRNAPSVARRENVYGKWVSVYNGKVFGNMYWTPDENGQFTDATDPRLNNGMVITNTNNPFDGIPFDEFGTPTYMAEANPGYTNMVVGFDRGEKMSNNASGFTPAIGVNYEISPQTFLYASYTQGYRLPSLFETTIGTLQVDPASGLKPERSRAIEIGASTTRESLITEGDVASFKLAYFNNDVKNYIVRYYDPFGTGLMTFSNADSYQTSGLEFQSNYDNGRFFAELGATYYLRTETCDADFAAYLRDKANASVKTQDAPDCTPGSYVGSYINTQNPPKYAVNLTVGGRFFEDRLTVGGRMTYTSGPTETIDKPWQSSDTTPQLYYHPVTVFDAFLSYKLREDTILNASVHNITDRYYLDPLAQSYMPAPGRTFRAGLTVKF